MTATEQLYALWDATHDEPSSRDYINELCDQLTLFGTESNTLTREMVLKRLERMIEAVKKNTP